MSCHEDSRPTAAGRSRPRVRQPDAGPERAAPLGDLEKPPTFLYYLVAFVLLAVIVFLSIMPAKRREQN